MPIGAHKNLQKMANREKTQLRHITKEGKKIRVTKEGDALYIGNTNERAEGKLTHHKGLVNGKLPKPYKYNNHERELDEWGDFAYTSADF